MYKIIINPFIDDFSHIAHSDEEEALAEQILSLHFCHDKELSVLSNEQSKILKLTAATAKERYVLCRLSSHVPKSH